MSFLMEVVIDKGKEREARRQPTVDYTVQCRAIADLRVVIKRCVEKKGTFSPKK
jgi:hypothetical protein